MTEDIEEGFLDYVLLYEIVFSYRSSGNLICVHCGEKLSTADFIRGKIILGESDEMEGYVSHIQCMLDYVIRSDPLIVYGTSNGIISETEIRTELTNRPFESVLLDLQRIYSNKKVGKKRDIKKVNDKCFHYITSVGKVIEARSNHNVDIIEKYLDTLYPDYLYSDYN